MNHIEDCPFDTPKIRAWGAPYSESMKKSNPAALPPLFVKQVSVNS